MTPAEGREVRTLHVLGELLESLRDINRDLDEMRARMDTFALTQSGSSRILTLAEGLQEIISEGGDRDAIRESLTLWAGLRQWMAQGGDGE